MWHFPTFPFFNGKRGGKIFTSVSYLCRNQSILSKFMVVITTGYNHTRYKAERKLV